MLLVTAGLHVKGQTSYSPYSNFGLGNISGPTNSSLRSLGGSSAAFRDYMVINIDNPASYTAFDTLSFVLDAGISIDSRTFFSVREQTSYTYGGLNNVNVGFPICKFIKASAGLVPFSELGYSITQTVMDTLIGDMKFGYVGKGGLSNAYFGLGIEIGPVSIGANASYIFGNLVRSHSLLYPDSTYFFCVKQLDELNVSSFYTNTGIQYNAKLSNSMSLCLGATYAPMMKLNSTEYKAAYTYTETNNIEVLRDTVSLYRGNGGVVLPMKIGGGFMLKKLNTFKILGNFEWQQWSKFQAYGIDAGTYNDSYKISLGYEHSPRNSSVSSYFKWIKYRMGAHFEKCFYTVDENSINQFGVTVGACFPIIRSASTVNLAIDVGNRGKRSGKMIQETYIKATLAFSLYDTWFYRVKYK